MSYETKESLLKLLDLIDQLSDSILFNGTWCFINSIAIGILALLLCKPNRKEIK